MMVGFIISSKKKADDIIERYKKKGVVVEVTIKRKKINIVIKNIKK